MTTHCENITPGRHRARSRTAARRAARTANPRSARHRGRTSSQSTISTAYGHDELPRRAISDNADDSGRFWNHEFGESGSESHLSRQYSSSSSNCVIPPPARHHASPSLQYRPDPVGVDGRASDWDYPAEVVRSGEPSPRDTADAQIPADLPPGQAGVVEIRPTPGGIVEISQEQLRQALETGSNIRINMRTDSRSEDMCSNSADQQAPGTITAQSVDLASQMTHSSFTHSPTLPTPLQNNTEAYLNHIDHLAASGGLKRRSSSLGNTTCMPSQWLTGSYEGECSLRSNGTDPSIAPSPPNSFNRNSPMLLQGEGSLRSESSVAPPPPTMEEIFTTLRRNSSRELISS